MGHKKDKFLQGQAFGLIFIDAILFPITSIIPEWSIKTFYLNLTISVLSIILAGYWYKTISNTFRYNTLVNFLIFISMGFFSVTPLLRMTLNTWLFWVFLLLYLFIFVYSLIKRELIFHSLFMRPGKSKLSKGFVAFIIIFMLVGSFTARNGQELLILKLLDDHQGAFFMGLFSYTGGLFFTFLSVILLRKPKEIVK